MTNSVDPDLHCLDKHLFGSNDREGLIYKYDAANKNSM